MISGCSSPSILHQVYFFMPYFYHILDVLSTSNLLFQMERDQAPQKPSESGDKEGPSWGQGLGQYGNEAAVLLDRAGL
jgi:hypothetical protein